jgi:hypothetical protein
VSSNHRRRVHLTSPDRRGATLWAFSGAGDVLYRLRRSNTSFASLTRAARYVEPPLVGVKFLHEPAVGATDLLRARTRLKAKDLRSTCPNSSAPAFEVMSPRLLTLAHVPAGKLLAMM